MKKLMIVSIVLLGHVAFSQPTASDGKKTTRLFQQAREAYDSRQYAKSLEIIDHVLSIDSCYADAYLMKSDIYNDLDSIVPQIKALETVIRLKSNLSPKLHYILGNACYKKGLYQKAYTAFQDYLSSNDGNKVMAEKAQKSMTRCEGALILLKNPVPFKSYNLGSNINSDDDEYWPSLTVDGKTIIFTRLVGSANNTDRYSPPQEDFYTSTFENGSWQPSKPISSINTLYNEGAQAISTDGKLLFFTACTRNDGQGSCDIYFSRNKAGEWSVAQNAGSPVNSAAWESQPSISANGEVLYFVSNRQGGKGGMDIWKCKLKGFSEWGTPVWGSPVNLGDSVNTPGNEISPFIHSDGKTLYFASDYWPGMGGFDIFYSRQTSDSSWSRPQNIGYPINSYKDEQGLVVDAAGRNAYYSSDRPGSKGMDIYSFELYKGARPTPVSYVKGKIIDEDSGTPVCAKVELADVENPRSVIRGESCWEKGEFLMCLPLGKEYAFNVSKEGYLFYSDNFRLKEKKEIIDPYILEIKLKRIKVGGAVVLRNVFFNTGSYDLLSESIGELQKLIDFLNLNKTVFIEIEGHTDNIGGNEMNQNLSESRARAVYNYLIDHGIDAGRMKYAGYGPSKPMSTNDTPEGRALNRRTEFRIIRK